MTIQQSRRLLRFSLFVLVLISCCVCNAANGISSVSDVSPTTLTFGDGIDGNTIFVKAGQEESFSSPSATLSPEIEGTIIYTSDNEDVVKVLDDGKVVFVGYGEATITASYKGDDTYAESSAWYKIDYALDRLVFSGDKGAFNNLPSSYSKNFKYCTLIEDQSRKEYSFRIQDTKLGTKRMQMKGEARSREIEIPKGCFADIKVEYYQTYTKGKSDVLYIKSDALVEPSKCVIVDKKEDGAISGFVATARVLATKEFTLYPGNLAYIDRITVTINPLPSVTVDEASDNAATLSQYDNERVKVSLCRKLVADKWNTFCVPFDLALTDGKMNDTEVDVREIDKVENNAVVFKSVTEMVAGHAYLVMPKGEDLVNPVFENVVIRNVDPEATGGNGISMIGTYSPMTFDEEACKSTLLIDSEAKFFRPVKSSRMKGMRAYFQIPVGTSENSMKITFDGNETGISDIESSGLDAAHGKSIYRLDGTYVGNDLNGLAKGVYIVDGQAVVVSR